MHLENTCVLSQKALGNYRVLELASERIAPAVRPGQFVHLRVPRLADAVLRRPLSVFRAEADRLALLYKPIGYGTGALTRVQAGDAVSLLGPLGNGFPVALPPDRMPVLVAGGYGVAPLFLLARELPQRGIVFAGTASAKDILCREDFEALGWDYRAATEDGTLGRQGLVTALLDDWMRNRPSNLMPEFYACGPDGMLRAVGERAVVGGWRAWLSLDRHMGCGVGACLACVQRLRRPEGIVWGRVCRDGPVFEAREIVWDEPGETKKEVSR